MSGILLLLGTNLGNRTLNLENARKALMSHDIGILNSSSIYESEPWGVSDQPWFLNQVIEVQTNLDPVNLLQKCLSIELQMGRVRKIKWGERLIDIDVLTFRDLVISSTDLTVPHPGIPERRFALEPIAELWPDWIHPKLKKSIGELMDSTSDNSKVRVFEGN